jgi:hypothetical protein
MNFRALIDWKRQEAEKAQALLDTLTSELETLEKAFAIAEREGVALEPPPVQETARPRVKRAEKKKKPERKAKSEGRSLAGAIREIVRDLEAPFTTGAVRERLKTLDPELYEATYHSSLASTMRRMSDKGELAVIEKGGPGKEATYGPSAINVPLFRLAQ